MTERITPGQFHEANGIEDWRVLLFFDGACAHFRTGSFAAGVALVDAIGGLPDAANHHPDVDLRSEGVTVRLKTHDIGGLSERDVELARQISAAARELDVPADPTALQEVDITIDALVGPEVQPFWRAVLAYREKGSEDLVVSMLRHGHQRLAVGTCGSYATAVGWGTARARNASRSSSSRSRRSTCSPRAGQTRSGSAERSSAEWRRRSLPGEHSHQTILDGAPVQLGRNSSGVSWRPEWVGRQPTWLVHNTVDGDGMMTAPWMLPVSSVRTADARIRSVDASAVAVRVLFHRSARPAAQTMSRMITSAGHVPLRFR